MGRFLVKAMVKIQEVDNVCFSLIPLSLVLGVDDLLDNLGGVWDGMPPADNNKGGHAGGSKAAALFVVAVICSLYLIVLLRLLLMVLSDLGGNH